MAFHRPADWSGREIFQVGETIDYHRDSSVYEAIILGGNRKVFYFYVASLGWIVKGAPTDMGDQKGITGSPRCRKYFYFPGDVLTLDHVAPEFFKDAEHPEELVQKAKILAMETLIKGIGIKRPISE